MTRALLLLFATSVVSVAQESEKPEKPAVDLELRAAHLKTLEGTMVHFDFARAPLSDVTRALERATKVEVVIGEKGQAALEKRKFKLKYVADRTGIQVLEDLAKAAALDWEVTHEGAILDTPAALAKLRKELGLPAKRRLLSAEDVEKMLDAKKVDLTARDRTLAQVLTFLRDETGIGFVHLAEEGAEMPKVSLSTGELTLREVLDKVAEKAGLAWARQGNVIVVGTEEAVRPKEEE